jgi:hypothetical protein
MVRDLKSLYLEVTHGKNGVSELAAMPEGKVAPSYAEVDDEVTFLLTTVLPLGLSREKNKVQGLRGLWEAYDDLVRQGSV